MKFSIKKLVKRNKQKENIIVYVASNIMKRKCKIKEEYKYI